VNIHFTSADKVRLALDRQRPLRMTHTFRLHMFELHLQLFLFFYLHPSSQPIHIKPYQILPNMTLMPLLGRYRLYKSGTKRLIDWLTNSASHCCDLKSIIKSLDTNFKTKISKTKGAETPLEIRTQELLKLAEAIAKSQPLVDIPDTITQIAKDVIAGREECAEWYSAQALGGDVERENESHRYFIMVLQKILKLLSEARATRPKSETEPKARKSKAKREARPPVQDDELSNLFDCLDIEEPSDSPLGDQVVSAVIRMPNTTKVVHFKLEKEDADTAFATWCFLQDLNDVHGFVREIWLEYSRGVISFLVASSVTDTAFGLMRCADEEFGRFSGETTAWYPLVTRLGLAAFNRGFAVWMCPIIPGSKPRVTDSSINVVELLCPIAGMVLGSYRKGAHEYCEYGKRLDREPDVKHRSRSPLDFISMTTSAVFCTISLPNSTRSPILGPEKRRRSTFSFRGSCRSIGTIPCLRGWW